MTDFEKLLREQRDSPEFRARQGEFTAMRDMAKAALWKQGAIAMDETGVVRALRFACNGCGKCCDTPPGMNLKEALRLADTFVLKAELRSVGLVDPDNPYDQHHLDMTYPDLDLDADLGRRERFSENLTAQAKALGIPAAPQEGPASDYSIRLMFTDLMDETGACPMRQEDGFCKIYGVRPAKCRVVPFDESIPFEDAGDAATFSIMRLLVEKKGTCLADRTAPVIWEDGTFTDPEIEEAHDATLMGSDEAERAAIKVATDEVLLFKSRDAAISRDDVERYCITRDATDPAPMSSMVPVLYRLGVEGFISFEDAVGILEKQIIAIEARLAVVPQDAAPHPLFETTYATMLEDWLGLYRDTAASWRMDPDEAYSQLDE